LYSSGDTHQNIEGEEETLHPIQAYTDGSKIDLREGAGELFFLGNHIIKKMQYIRNERCSNNQSEQIAILKSPEYIKTWNRMKK